MVKIKSFLSKYWIEIFIGLHFSKFVYLFHEIRFSSGLPITNVDFSLYYARVYRTHEFLTRSGQIWGYDPFLMGGYVAGAVDGAGTFFVGWLCHILSALIPIETSLLLFEIAGYLVMPFLLLPVVRNFGGTKNQAWGLFAVFVLMYGHFEYYTQGYFRYTMALFWFCLAVCFSFWQVSQCWKWLNNKKFSSWVGLVLISTLSLQIYPSVVAVILVPNVLLYLLFWKQLTIRQHALVWGGVFLVFISNWYWMAPFISFSNWLVPTSDYEVSLGWAEISRHLLPFKGSSHESVQYVLNTLLLILAGLTLKNLKKSNKKFFVLFSTWAGTIFLLGYFGSHLPFINQIQPHRFIYPLWILFYVLASFSIPTVLNQKRLRDYAFVILLIAVPFGWWNMVAGNLKGPPLNELKPEQEKLMQFISSKIDPQQGRVMIEMEESESDEPAKPHFYDLIPIFTNQALSVGPNPGNFLKSRFSDFLGVYWDKKDPWVFGKKLKELSSSELSSYLNLYNVTTVITYSKVSKKIFSSHSEIMTSAEDVGSHSVFRVKSEPSWFVEGEGNLSFDYDEIQVDNASKGISVLKLHWIHSLKSDVQLEPVYFLNDPTPFIKINNSKGKNLVKIWNGKLN